ncbi:MAG: BrnT family toxin [Rhodospirillales bacterium]|nr:BrnT family toxin [Rhodospirillales bacterium]
MEFEWHEAKRLANIEKHGIDFLDADIVFGGPHLIGPARAVAGEARWMAVGMLDDVYVTVIFTRRGNTIRLISMRSARREERERHQTLFGR